MKAVDCDGCLWSSQTVGSLPPISTTTTVVIIETPIKAIIDGGSSVVVGQYHCLHCSPLAVSIGLWKSFLCMLWLIFELCHLRLKCRVVYFQWLKWARMCQNWGPGRHKIVTMRSWASTLPTSRTLVFSCPNSVPRSWILRHCWWPILPCLTTYLYYDYSCVFTFSCLYFTKHYHNWNCHLSSLFCIHGVL